MREAALSPPPAGGADAPAFADTVRRALAERGIEVRVPAGAGPLPDLAIGAADGGAVGVECGEGDAAAPSARDRDRLRREALEDAGWRVLRVTPSAWAEDREREIARLDPRAVPGRPRPR